MTHTDDMGDNRREDRVSSDIDEFYDELRQEAEAEGPEAVSGMRALATFYSTSLELRRARLERSLTQRQLSELTGIAQPEISRIEGGQANVTVATLGALAGALGLRVALVPTTEAGGGPVR